MDTLADSLQDLDIYSRGTTVITVILKLFITDDPTLSFFSCKS